MIEKNPEIDSKLVLRDELMRYVSFWPFFFISVIFFLSISFIYLKYVNYSYQLQARVEIIDKSQDSEMALPTSMTIFNRSMVNLENEIGKLTSYSINRNACSVLSSNIKYYSIGTLKTSENHSEEWFPKYDIEFYIDSNTIEVNQDFSIDIYDNRLSIVYNDIDGAIKEIDFDGLNTRDKKHNLPFDLTIFSYDKGNTSKKLSFRKLDDISRSFQSSITVQPAGSKSDQLYISLKYPNFRIAQDYINTLLQEFDKDGVLDRQREYTRTIEFVDTRSVIISAELEKIEDRKQNFKVANNLTEIQSDVSVNYNQLVTYDSEIFQTNSQKDLILLVKDILNESDFQLLPSNIGIENSLINGSIIEYNNAIKDRDRFGLTAGSNNTFLKNLESEITEIKASIFKSLDNYNKSLDLRIENLVNKEVEYSEVFKSIPENEKILRSIERELKIKEALFLLLLQKREEAAINYAVVRPTIKIIDSARGSLVPVSPNKRNIYIISIVLALLIPFSLLYLWFTLDNKIHTKDQLSQLLGSSLNVIGEIPFVDNAQKEVLNSFNNLRSLLSESIRMIMVNLNFIFIDKDANKCKVILTTSSIKGEGKTLLAVSLANNLSSKDKKVLLLGCDLRNPQIHKYLEIDKSVKGITNIIHDNDLSNIKDYIQKVKTFDIILSGVIPPNPTEVLESKAFEQIINFGKENYDYIVIDSAPTLLVSDTFVLDKFTDGTLYVVRSNHTSIKVVDFILENHETKRLTNINIVLNSVGNSGMYGYRYGYQYGYKYGYKYGYNYGYGYGYSEDKD